MPWSPVRVVMTERRVAIEKSLQIDAQAKYKRMPREWGQALHFAAAGTSLSGARRQAGCKLQGLTPFVIPFQTIAETG
jgi:hypothetical protein